MEPLKTGLTHSVIHYLIRTMTYPSRVRDVLRTVEDRTEYGYAVHVAMVDLHGIPTYPKG